MTAMPLLIRSSNAYTLWYIANMKTLEAPYLDRILDPVGRCLTPEVARALVGLRLDRKTQAHIDSLARRCNKGKLTATEHSEYESYVLAINFVGMLQSKARRLLDHNAKQ